MTVFVQQRLLDADMAEERAEELIDHHKIDTEYVGVILESAIRQLAGVMKSHSILGAPFDGRDVATLVDDLRRFLPPDYERDREAMIELSALAHRAAMKEME